MKKKKVLASILITNFNKDRFIRRNLKSCLNQSLNKNIEVLVFDDCSNDNSLKILENYKNKISIIKNRVKKYNSGPLNQIFGILKLFKKAKGKIIFLLDSDDYFYKKKVSSILNHFKKNSELNFIQDKPYSTKEKRIIKLKNKKHFFSIWPSFYPTSCITVKKKFFLDFRKNLNEKKFPNLEIDARMCIFAFLTKSFTVFEKNLTVYNFDNKGITSKYKKLSINWWKKRDEAYAYMKILMKKFKIRFKPGPDYYLTKLINFFI
tara:strand:+ start:3564 stop:4352 length:789 start_codon:yes stop_codon:yes gene_type:complete